MCNALMMYSVAFGLSIVDMSFKDWVIYIACLLGVFLLVCGYHHLLFSLAHKAHYQGLVLGLIILLIPAWISGFTVEMYLIIVNALVKDPYWKSITAHLIGFIIVTALASPPLRYLCYLFPEIIKVFNPLALPDDDFKVSDTL